MARGHMKNPEPKEPLGLSDPNIEILVCSNCQVPLAQILATNPEFDETLTFQANCCYCGDHSFEKEVQGRFYVGSTEYSTVDNQEEIDGTVILNTVKGNVKWQSSK